MPNQEQGLMRSMPCAPQAEASLLGTMLMYPTASRIAVEEGLVEQDFFIEANQTVYHALVSLYQDDIQVDMTTAATRLKDLNTFELIGGFQYLTQLADAAVTSANTKNYVNIIKIGRASCRERV